MEMAISCVVLYNHVLFNELYIEITVCFMNGSFVVGRVKLHAETTQFLLFYNRNQCLSISIFMICLLFQSDAEKMYRIFKAASTEQSGRAGLIGCGMCGDPTSSFKILSSETGNVSGKDFRDMDFPRRKVRNLV